MGTDINIFTEVYITDPADSSRKIWYNADVCYNIIFLLKTFYDLSGGRKQEAGGRNRKCTM